MGEIEVEDAEINNQGRNAIEVENCKVEESEEARGVKVITEISNNQL